MSLSKLPFILTVIIGKQVTYAEPTSPALEHERARATKKEGIFRPGCVIPYTKVFYLIPTVLEAAVVVVNNTKSLPDSRRILDVLMMGGKAEDIYLTPLAALGAFLILSGALMRRSCYRWMGRQFMHDVAIRDNHKLITGGPYSVVRHPSYTAASLVAIGIFCFHFTRGSWIRESGLSNSTTGLFLIGMLISSLAGPFSLLMDRMRVEDDTLRKEFGEAWDEWAKKVPYLLIPGIL